jgi:hypothetical protein
LGKADGAEEGAGDSDEDAGDGAGQASAAAPKRRQQPKPGKGKKKGKKGKKPKKQPTLAEESRLDDVPLESYRIIQDTEGIITDYLMAVYDIVRRWMHLKAYLQGVWRECAYEDMNTAVAGTLCKVATSMIEKEAAEMFVDFPGHDTYETIMNTITRGDPDMAGTKFTLALVRFGPDGTPEKVDNKYLDVREQFMIHTYEHLVDFIEDYQKTRSGKPTKRMLAEIRDWDPKFDLQRANNEERIRWRRSYIINWLYDLVNLHSAVVMQRINQKGEKHVLENVDWSPRGPWAIHRTLYGINEFSAFVTTLAMQKQGTDIRKRILPQHVFQLQCIIDSLMVTRGWSIHSMKGHILRPPPRNFRPRRDVDLFLDRYVERIPHGFLNGCDVLPQFLDKDAELHGDPKRHDGLKVLLKWLLDDFRDWLGESKYMSGLNTIPPSRFSNTNANGLWEYSPYLCGVGLAEALELAYLIGMHIWERIPEPMVLVHLHNMLLKKGYLKKSVGLYASLEQLFPFAFYADGKPPSSGFAEAFLARAGKRSGSAVLGEAMRREAAKTLDLRNYLKVDTYRFFNIKSFLVALGDAKWNLDAVPDADLPLPSMLSELRLSRTKRIVDPVTGKVRPEETELVRRLRAIGRTDKQILEDIEFGERLAIGFTPPPMMFDGDVPPEILEALGQSPSRYDERFRPQPRDQGPTLQDRDLMIYAMGDLMSDIQGELHPLSSFNYVWATAHMMMVFMEMEKELGERRNKVYEYVYKKAWEWARFKRVGLAFVAMRDEDEECLRVMADAFEKLRVGFMGFIYWEDLMSTSDVGEKSREKHFEQEEVPEDQCCVM